MTSRSNDLKPGDVLVKLRGGARRRVKVLRVHRKLGVAMLEDLAPSNRETYSVRTHAVNLGQDGLPEGYRRSES